MSKYKYRLVEQEEEDGLKKFASKSELHLKGLGEYNGITDQTRTRSR